MLPENAESSYIGYYILGAGFLMTPEEAARHIEDDPRNAEVLQPYVSGEDLVRRWDLSAPKWVINFGDRSLQDAETWPALLEIVERCVKPQRDAVRDRALRENWWRFARTRPEMRDAIAGFDRVIVVARVSKAVAPVFAPTSLAFSEQVVVFPFDDTATFAVLASNVHWLWAAKQASTLETRLRYSPSDCFETFPLPRCSEELTAAGAELDEARNAIMWTEHLGITKLYNRLSDSEDRGDDIEAVRGALRKVDSAVLSAYGWDDLTPEYGIRPTSFGPRYLPDQESASQVHHRLVVLNHEGARQ